MKKIVDKIIGNLNLKIQTLCKPVKYRSDDRRDNVEIIGPPCIGKTTILNNLNHDFYSESEFFSIPIWDINSVYGKMPISYEKLLEMECSKIFLECSPGGEIYYSMRQALDVALRKIFLDYYDFKRGFVLSDGFFQRYYNVIPRLDECDGLDCKQIFSGWKIINITTPDVDFIINNINRRRSLKFGFGYRDLVGVELISEVEKKLTEYQIFLDIASKNGAKTISIDPCDDDLILKINNFIN